jgi:hypothetical protein
VVHRHETGAAVGVRELGREQPRGPRVRLVRARPVQRVAAVEPRIADPGIVGGPAGGCGAQLREHVSGHGGKAAGRLTQPYGEVAKNLQVGPDPVGSGQCLPAAQDAAFKVRHRAVFLGPLRHGQDDVGL